MLSKSVCEFADGYYNLEGEELDEYVRSAFNKTLKGKSFYQACRANNIELFGIIEYMIEEIIFEDVEMSQFFDDFVEVKNRIYGDITGWYSCEDSILSVSRFAGNHYDTNCARLKASEGYTLPSEWVYVDIQEELEKFMSGVSSLEYVKNKICHVINKHIQDRIYMNLQNMLEYSKPEYQRFGILSFESNGQEQDLESLCDIVKKHNKCSKCIIAGSRNSLLKLTGELFDETSETITEWNGNKIMCIPTLTNGSDFDNKLLVFGDTGYNKPIKFDFIGDTRVKFMEPTESMSYFVVQTCICSGALVPNGYGVFTFNDN